MTAIEENNKNESSPKRLILTSIFLFVNILILLFLFSLYFEFGATPIIIFLIFLFGFLTFFPLFFKKEKSLYSRIFPDKKKAKVMQRRQKEFIRTRVEPKIPQQKEIKAVDLSIKSKGPSKPLIKKCGNCGMIIASFVKKCPACGKSVID